MLPSNLKPHELLHCAVDALCRRGLHAIAYGSGPHVLAVTESGDLLSWGHNGYCQLGNNCNTQGLVPSSISAGLSHRVAQVACGSHHSLALTTNGDVSDECIVAHVKLACSQSKLTNC